MYKKTNKSKKRQNLPSANTNSAFDNYTKTGLWPGSKSKKQREETHKRGKEKSKEKYIKKRLKQIS